MAKEAWFTFGFSLGCPLFGNGGIRFFDCLIGLIGLIGRAVGYRWHVSLLDQSDQGGVSPVAPER
jgi:hypothetical protein